MDSNSAIPRTIVPFASSGAKNTIPVTTADTSAASYTLGFPPLTAIPIESGGVAPTYQDFNGILYDLSNSIMWLQAMGVLPWDSTVSYPKGAVVTYKEDLYISTSDENIGIAPGTNNGKWTVKTVDFTPVQQGTGVGQGQNTVKIGWDGYRIRATIDSEDKGGFVLESKMESTLSSILPLDQTTKNPVGKVILSDGSSSSPSISFSSDILQDTGIYHPAGGEMNAVCNGKDVLMMSQSGVHIPSGSTETQPIGDSSKNLANTEFVTRFSSSLGASSGASLVGYGNGTLKDFLDTVKVSSSSGMVGFATASAMNADLAHGDGTVAVVLNDPTAGNNAFYRKTGASGAGGWTQASPDLMNNSGSVLANLYARYLNSGGRVQLHGKVVLDAGVLRVPAFRLMRAEDYIEISPSNGQRYFEVPVDTEDNGNTSIVYFDVPSQSLRVLNIYSAPVVSFDDALPYIAMIYGGGVLAIGGQPQFMQNDFHANVVGYPDIMGSGTVMHASGDMQSIGAWQIFKSSTRVEVGGVFSTPGEYAFARVYVLSDQDDAPVIPAFEIMTVAGIHDPSSGISSLGYAVLEKIHSTRMRSYVLGTKNIPAVTVGIRAVLDVPSGRSIALGGLQYARGHDANSYIGTSDHPTFRPLGSGLDSLFYSAEAAALAGRSYRLYPRAMRASRNYVSSPLAASVIDNPSSIITASGTDELVLPLGNAQDGNTLRIAQTYQNGMGAVYRQQIDVPVRVMTAQQLNGKTVRVLSLGDSITDNWRTLAAAGDVLAHYGCTMQRTGTLTGSSAFEHEGRSGKRLADYLCMHNDTFSPTTGPVYLAAQNYPTRYELNPFAFPSSSPNSHGGYAFDFGQYLSTYSSEVGSVDVVVINLGTNDRMDYDNAVDFSAFISSGITQMIQSIRAAGCKVLVAAQGMGWDDYTAEVGPRLEMQGRIRGMLRAVKSFNDPKNVRFCPAFAHQSPWNWSAINSISTDHDTGFSVGALADSTHMLYCSQQEYAEAVAAHIAAMIV